MATKPRSEKQRKRDIVRAFCDFLYAVPVGQTFTLWNLQGTLRGFGNIPAEQMYAEHFSVAQKRGWIEPVESEPDTYRRTGHRRSAASRGELSDLQERIIHVIEGREFHE